MAEKPEKKIASVKSILSREEKPKAEPKSSEKKKKHKHTHIEHHYDAQGKEMGHTVRHTPEGGGAEISYAAPDLDAVHDGLEEHVGSPNAGEGQEAEAAEPQPQASPQTAQGA